MARSNRIFAGPENKRLTRDRVEIAATTIMPGTAIFSSGNKFVQAGSASSEVILLAQENLVALKGVDDAWFANGPMLGLELLRARLFYARVPTGVSIAAGVGLTTNAAGRFVPATTGQRIIAWAEEAFNNTSGAEQLVRTRPA